MRIASPVGHKRARFEIIPLIDIMFFLLAAFMMVSLTMIRVESMRMNLPTPTAASSGKKPPMINIEIDPAGDAYIDKVRMTIPDLFTYLTNRHSADTDISAYIKGNPESKHGHFITVLDTCRRAGIQKVSCNITLPQKK